jgi:hypothetical protein
MAVLQAAEEIANDTRTRIGFRHLERTGIAKAIIRFVHPVGRLADRAERFCCAGEQAGKPNGAFCLCRSEVLSGISVPRVRAA